MLTLTRLLTDSGLRHWDLRGPAGLIRFEIADLRHAAVYLHATTAPGGTELTPCDLCGLCWYDAMTPDVAQALYEDWAAAAYHDAVIRTQLEKWYRENLAVWAAEAIAAPLVATVAPLVPAIAPALREAARLMRERAEATARPHHPYADKRMQLVETTEQWSAEVRNYLGGDMGGHCASMHPGVALAVAGWLDGVAQAIGTGDPEDLLGLGEPTAAFAIARAYLGGPQ